MQKLLLTHDTELQLLLLSWSMPVAGFQEELCVA